MSDNKVVHPEFHKNYSSSRLNWLRAAVLGANDGIVSISGLVVGVASATTNLSVILTAGVAGIIAGAISMAAGEYVSVSSQSDSEKAQMDIEEYELENFPDEELKELEGIYEKKGLSKKTAKQVAKELTGHNALHAHLEVELGIDPDDLTNPYHAAFASAAAFISGAAIPLAAILLPPEHLRIPLTFAAVVFALTITGYLSARAGQAKARVAIQRVVLWGVIAMAVTFLIGKLFGAAV
ncbi:MAG: VIT family protein [Candidatus Saccharimonadales bacterium]